MSNQHKPNGNGPDKSYEIIVNGRPKVISDHKLTYLEVVELAYPGEKPSDGVVFTVTFSNPHGKDGSMVEGDKVVVKDGIIINVRKTDKS